MAAIAQWDWTMIGGIAAVVGILIAILLAASSARRRRREERRTAEMEERVRTLRESTERSTVRAQLRTAITAVSDSERLAAASEKNSKDFQPKIICTAQAEIEALRDTVSRKHVLTQRERDLLDYFWDRLCQIPTRQHAGPGNFAKLARRVKQRAENLRDAIDAATSAELEPENSSTGDKPPS